LLTLPIGVDDLTAAIMRITDGVGARVVFKPVGGPDFENNLKATSKDAIVSINGALSHEARPGPILQVMGKHFTIRGYEFIEVTATDEKIARAKKFITDGLSKRKFSP